MDAKKKIQKQICGSTWIVTTGLVALAVFVLTMAIFPPVAVMAMMVAFFFLLIGLLTSVPAMTRAKKYVKALEEKGLLEKAAAELDGPTAKVIGKNKGVITENFLFGNKTGIVLPHSDILWTYKHKQTTTVLFVIPIMTVESLMVCTAKKQGMMVINLGGKDKKEELKDAILTIYRSNPRTLVGYSQENQQAYKQLRNTRV